MRALLVASLLPRTPAGRAWRAAAFLGLFLLGSCSAQPLRTAAEREALGLTKQLAADYFGGKPVPSPAVQAAVHAAIVDIERRLGLQGTSPLDPVGGEGAR